MKNKDFVLEIGTEELPPSVVNIAKEPSDVKTLVETLIGDTGLVSEKLKYSLYITPRRIIIHIKDLPDFYNKIEVGPPKRIAYDKEGNPTRALEGFLKKTEAIKKDITKIPENDDEKITVSKKISAKNLIAERITRFVKSFESFKTMIWESERGIKFPRPIRWVLALYGDEAIPLRVGLLTASNITYGHRLFSPDAIKVKNPQDFFKKLKKDNIVYDFGRRRKIIENQLKKNHWHINLQLLDEVTGLVECPAFIKGGYNKEYLKLPQEVLIASMSKNQRVFPLEGKNNNVINKFIAVTDGNIKNIKRIKQNYEQVLDAKLKDALFFYNEDLKKSLAERTKQLKDMIFHKKLGSYADKIERLKQLTISFKEALKLTNSDCDKIIRACELCKADLLTQMVSEFPSLQGIMGKYYALAEGIDKEIAQAIEEHYKPRFFNDKLPETKIGSILALLDRFDSVICHFKTGHQPKGNWDLYALRRQSIGIINIILKNKIGLSLSDMFDEVFRLAPGDADEKKLKDEFMEFIKERLIAAMKLDYKFKHDLIDSVLSSGFDNIYRFYLRLSILNNINDEFYFKQARCVVERTNNITKNISHFIDKMDTALFQLEEEKQLYEKYKSIQDKMKAYIQQDKYQDATKLYGNTLSDMTNSFFNKVMVNVEDKKLRNNRLKLLKEMNGLYVENIADLSKIVVSHK